ncbi:hypothetical protein [Tolypothrix sp. VBCCA 56010]
MIKCLKLTSFPPGSVRDTPGELLRDRSSFVKCSLTKEETIM